MFMVTAENVLAIYAPFIEGNPTQTAMAISSAPLSQEARDALAKSVAALGYGEGSLTYICKTSADGFEASAGDVLTMVEGLDPLCLIATDAAAATVVGDAFRCEVPSDAFSRVRGRSTVAFAALEPMLANADGKQTVWALLKKLRLK